jgi:hypothetical protein
MSHQKRHGGVTIGALLQSLDQGPANLIYRMMGAGYILALHKHGDPPDLIKRHTCPDARPYHFMRKNLDFDVATIVLKMAPVLRRIWDALDDPEAIGALLLSGLFYELTENGEGQRLGWKQAGLPGDNYRLFLCMV